MGFVHLGSVVFFKGTFYADSISNICKKKSYKKNYFFLINLKKVYVFKHQQLS